MSARDEFISGNLGLVHLCVKRYTGRNIEYDDLFQAGCMGLVKAADKFEPQRGLKFSTYAVPVILGEIRRLFREEGSVKVGRALKDLSLKAARTREKFVRKNGREPTLGELAETLGVEPEQAALALNAALPAVSLTESEEDGGGQADLVCENFDSSLTDILALRQAMLLLEPCDRKLIWLRFFKEQNQTQTALMLNMTQVQVSRREKKIINILREKMNV